VAFFDIWLGIARFTFYVSCYSRADPCRPSRLWTLGSNAEKVEVRSTLKTRIYRWDTEYSVQPQQRRLYRSNQKYDVLDFPPLECVRALSHHDPWTLHQPASRSDWLSQP
jgi:hypothetical protein